MDILLESYWEPKPPYTKYYQKEPHPTFLGRVSTSFHISPLALHRPLRLSPEELGSRDWSELLQNAYALQLIKDLSLQHGGHREPRRVQSGNWIYCRDLNPDISVEFDLDIEKDYLVIAVVMPRNDSRLAKIIEVTCNFMERLDIRRAPAPRRDMF